jgi:hypothetical protein
MDDSMCRRLSLEPGQSAHRRYEVLRAIFVDGLPLNQVADRFGYCPAALRSPVSRFRSSSGRRPALRFLGGRYRLGNQPVRYIFA